MEPRLLRTLRQRPGWERAITVVQERLEERGDEARTAASTYASVYEGRRAAMVVDVITSRQRKYKTRVEPLVATFEQTPAAASLESLASLGCPLQNLRSGEADTIQQVATGLVRFGHDNALTEDDQVALGWANATGGLETVPRLDPYVGGMKGIGPALFAYLRMRAGGGGIKPDLRVFRALRDLGFDPPRAEPELIVLGQAIAEELGISTLVLDQLLW